MSPDTEQSHTLHIGFGDGIIWTGNRPGGKSLNLHVEIGVGESAVQSTKVIERTRTPVWNQKFVINGNHSSIVSLSVKHYNWPFGGDTCIGQLNIPIGTLLTQCAGDKFTILEMKSNTAGNNESSMGNITIKLIRVADVGNSAQGQLAGELGINHALSFDRLGQSADLDEAILQLQTAVQLTDDGHPDKSRYYFTLGDSQRARFELMGELVDLEESISNLQTAALLTDDGHPAKYCYLGSLGNSQLRRYERFGELTDLQNSISNMRCAVQFPLDGPMKLMHLSVLGLGQLKRYNRLGQLTDIEDCISNLQKAVQHNDGDPNQSIDLGNLGISQRTRYECLGELTDIEDSILNLQKAVQFTEDGDPYKLDHLSDLGISQLKRYERLGELADIEDCISNLRKSVQLSKAEHPNLPTYLSNLGISQLKRWERLGKLTDLTDSISNLTKAVLFTTDGNPSKPMYLGNLGLSQLRHYERFGILADIKDSISNFQKAVVLTLDGHINKPLYLGNLGIGQLRLYECLGELTDVEDSISNLQKATQFTETGHTDKPMFLSNLGTSHMMRYHRLGELTDLEDCIFNLQKVVGLTDEGHPDKPIRLSNFGLSQLKRFERLGDLADIEDCISNLQKAVQHTEDGHPNMPAYLGNLGISQGKLYDRLGEQIDLEDSISNLGKAVQFTMDGHRDKPIYLGNLGTSQLRLYWRFAELTSLEDSILNLQKSVLLTEDGHPDKPIYISNLGVCQRIRFEHLGKLTDLQNSISNLHEAVRLTEDEHPNKPRYFGNLGLSQLKRYECNSEQTDIEEAIWHFKKAVQLTDEDHPRRANCLSELGTAQRLRFECLGRPADLIDSISAFREAAKSKTAYPRDTLSAARQWAEASHRNGDLPSALDGYRLALEILPKVAWLGLSTTSRQNWLIQEGSENLTCLSATCAIQLGCLEEAVELLDLGRSVFWQQASSLRSDLEELRKMEPELADCLGKVGQKLDAGNFSSSLLSDREQHIGAHDAQDVGKERRRLVAEWQGLLDRVRQLPQFEHFLKPVPFRQLRQAANGGQVVLINASEYGVDALIFDAADQIEHVPLPKATVGALSKLAGDILLHRPITAFEAQRHSYNGRYLKPALRTVWNDILIPIFQRIHLPLHGNSDAPKRRIWWYPTGPLTFIPIHAAGPGKNENDASRLVISSYVTTLGSLFQAQKKWRQCDFRRPKFLAVSQQDTPGQESLPLAMEEVDKVLQIVNSAGWPKEDTVRLSGSDATVDRVSGALDSTSWIHLACHGIQHPISGMKSALALHNGDLELNHIASKRLSSGQFAFLSACHTAAGLQRLPGEAMHIAGGLQFSGFPSVIATMWGVSDKDAPVVACHTYEYLFRNGVEGCDPSEAATALICAVLRLREDPNVTVDRWAPFIHFGI